MRDQAYHVFLSHSRNDAAATADVLVQFHRHGLDVFKDDESSTPGDEWLARLQQVLEECGAFVVLVGCDGVRRWIGAEAQVALNRHFGPHDDARRLPIFPILLDETEPEALPPLLRLFQVTRWRAGELLPADLLKAIRDRNILKKVEPIAGCPFVGLASYRAEQAHLFFGRQKETLDALACFRRQPTGPLVKWLEINGNSGSGKSSLMNAGLLPLIEQGWLWPRTGFAQWWRIGPMMPGAKPVGRLAEALARAWQVEMADVSARLNADGDTALAHWLRTRKKDDTAFLLVIDQFEELFTFADADERGRFDRLLATALEDADCPLFIVSTVRADFLDRFAEDLPRLVEVRNRLGRAWTMPSIGIESLREVIQGPADLAGLDVAEIKELMVAEARDEAGALPMVENALHWLWQQRKDDCLSGRLFADQGGLAGILIRGANDLLASLDEVQRGRALELLFRLVRVDREGIRHARQRLDRGEALKIAGVGEAAGAVIDCLSGRRRLDGGQAEGPLRLITVNESSVNLIHETLIRSKGPNADGTPQPYWPTLWGYIEQHKERAAWLERLREDVAAWLAKGRNAGLQWSHERVREAAGALQPVVEQLSADEREFLGPIDPDEMLAELELPETTHRRRLLIGERLDVLGDPRAGMSVDANGTPEIDWCEVAGGDVTVPILTDPNDPFSDIEYKHRLAVSPFRIARHPITVTQYRAFVGAADGWCNPEWWGDDLYRESEGGAYEFGRFGNYPATYVSWFDATAFCRWLSQRLDLEVRLPDEWEWQQAATGGDDRSVFPWGTDWDAKSAPWRANTFASRLGQVTAVGMYPAGATVTGIQDMGGTVWEWCRNKFEIHKIVWFGPSHHDPCTLRGASWFARRVKGCSVDRYWYDPGARSSHFGFRVICLSPTVGH